MEGEQRHDPQCQPHIHGKHFTPECKSPRGKSPSIDYWSTYHWLCTYALGGEKQLSAKEPKVKHPGNLLTRDSEAPATIRAWLHISTFLPTNTSRPYGGGWSQNVINR